MALLSALLHLSLLAAAHATSTGAGIRSCPSEEITWSSCDLNGTNLPVSCGSLSVPLDYMDEASNTTVNLELRRIPAANSPSRGSILFNFGGPGVIGFGDFAMFGEVLRVLTGGYHDLIVFAPRGTSNTIPFSCYDTSVERSIAQLGIVAGNASDVALGQLWANRQIAAETCYARQNETGGLIGTAFVARDMMCIVDALGEDGMLRYWGYSYGTILGLTAAAMFPDRMDKIILDGAVNPHEYYQNKETEIFTDADKVFTAFCTGCLATPSACALAHLNLTTPAALQSALTTLFTTIKYNPPVLPLLGSHLIIDYTVTKQLLLLNLYSPAAWPAFSSALHGLFTGNTTAVADYLIRLGAGGPSSDDPTSGTTDALAGIKCSDVYDSGRAEALDGVMPAIRGRRERSAIVGAVPDYLPIQCAQWRMPARERVHRWQGGVAGCKNDSDSGMVETRGRVLVIGNTGDPVTPLASARNISAGLKGSVVLEHGGYGHCSIAQASLCTALATRAYFVNGTLPEPGTVCKADVSLFAGSDGWDEVLQQFGVGGEGNAKRSVTGLESARRLVGMEPLKPVFIPV
ncbi:alpha/beta-hydrolase [Parathielavia hyrcaniae]|uniref:Alpha/beta-hydrolase n=1 Tax=Parathielavia hyrcaniae TaxID=113614 RepID=A0AAN6T195_9PEZI|nr:alpha/beta-hydrolase [Parathielavia hyrcaniae]